MKLQNLNKLGRKKLNYTKKRITTISLHPDLYEILKPKIKELVNLEMLKFNLL